MDDGYIKTLKMAQQGAPLAKVVETFNASVQKIWPPRPSSPTSWWTGPVA